MASKIVIIAGAYVRSMRPYTFFVTGTAGILGILLVGANQSVWRIILVLALLFTSYGINQVINDLLGSKEDKYNAPARPIVSGEIAHSTAILITVILVLVGAAAVYILNPYALIIYFLAYVMNFMYEYFKGIPMFGNLWFGLMIALAPICAALVSGSLSFYEIMTYPGLLWLAAMVAASASALCYYTYFKDYEGDKLAGKRTLIVALGPVRAARYLNLPMSLLPFVLLWFCVGVGVFKSNGIFLALAIVAFIFCQYAAFYTIKNPGRSKEALEMNFECTPIFLCALAALFDPLLAIVLAMISFVTIKISYWLMYREVFY